uniref:DUF4283 domain-containing protein n=1 Tax=Salix viminalis TaxID=40686 RepID=A0A6N2LTQ3_SALVM
MHSNLLPGANGTTDMAAKKSSNPTRPHAKPQLNTWADRVKVTDSSTRFTLEPIQRTAEESKPEITGDMLTENAEQWTRCMVGFFPGYKMNYHTVNTIANRVWKTGGLESVMSTTNGFWLFRFQTEDQMHAILERGPWMFGGKAIILQQWHPQFVFDKNRISKLPVWIRLHGLPFSLWSRKGLSVAASMVGKPLSCDEATYCCTRLDFARVCVEIDAELPFTHNFDIQTPCAKDPLHIEVEYEWKPSRCESCKLFGHVCKKPKVNIVGGEDEGKTPREDNENPPPTKAVVLLPSRQPLATTNPSNPTKPSQPSNPTNPKQDNPQKKKNMPTNSSVRGITLEPQEDHKKEKEEEEKIRKGKMKEDIYHLTVVNETTSLQSRNQDSQMEEASNENNVAYGSEVEPRDTSSMEFTKVKKKKGSKRNKEAYCL